MTSCRDAASVKNVGSDSFMIVAEGSALWRHPKRDRILGPVSAFGGTATQDLLMDAILLLVLFLLLAPVSMIGTPLQYATAMGPFAVSNSSVP